MGVFEVCSPDSIVSRLLLVAIDCFFWGDPVREICLLRSFSVGEVARTWYFAACLFY